MKLDDGASAGWVAKALACGGVAILLLYLLGWLLAAMVSPLRALSQSMTCQSNLMRLARAFRMYADDYDDHLPAAPAWMDRVVTYVDGPARADARLHCPAVGRPGETRYGYAMNAGVGGKARADIADTMATPLMYDSATLSRSAADTAASLPRPGRHTARGGRGSRARRGNFIGYVGGSVAIKVDPAEAP